MSAFWRALRILGMGIIGCGAIVGYAMLCVWNMWFITPLCVAMIITMGILAEVLLKVGKSQ